MSGLPRHAVTRAAKLATLPLGYAGRAAIGVGKRIGGAPAEAVAAEMHSRAAEHLFSVLGELKGGAMKFGQALSIFESAMPEDAARPYRAMLTKLQDSAPGLPAATVHEVLTAELGPDWRDDLTSFDDEPVAAASIGQVHRATWRDGQPVAVKIQYPGAAKALLSDLANVSRAAKMATLWIPGIEIGPILEELRGRMAEELDYRLEASNQQTFADAFAGDPHVAVPSVLASSERVIVAEWLDGIPLSTIITDGSAARRDAIGTRYMEFLLASPGKCGLLHADPHPGNFKMLDDGRLGVLDFGAVKHLPDGLPAEMGRLLVLALGADHEAVLTGLRDIGFVRGHIDVDPERLLEYLEPFITPLRTDTFTFSRSWIREVFAHINDPRKPTYTVGTKLNLPPEYLLIHRVWLGGIGVLCQLGSEVPGRAMVAAHIPGADLPPVGS